ncbi:hypothetical protein KVMX100_60266 [Klebsiella variicola]|nr:hypothetical protein KVMX100_60266 [Klebsiella variicola]
MTRHKPAGSCTQATRVAHKWEKGITKTSPGGWAHEAWYGRESFRRWPHAMPEGHLLAIRDDALRRGLV